jgi:type VII secretion-associated serine protease mycosin
MFDSASVLVRFERDVDAKAARAIAAGVGAHIAQRVPGTRFFLLRTARGRAAAALRALSHDARVVVVEPNFVREAAARPNDLLFARDHNQRHYLELIRAPEAWDIARGSNTVTIAIVDTGVDLDHPDLAARVVPGRDFVNGDSSALDDNGHGTMVAGIAAAATNNALGVAGVTWSARILPVKVLAANGEGTDADIAAGITWAVDSGATILNLSFAGTGSSSVLREAIDHARSKGAVIVAASGNDGWHEDPMYPAAYGGVVAVTATSWAGDVTWFSNRGSWVSLAAPGFEIASAYLAPGAAELYAVGSGTSFASAFVTGTAALIRAQNPAWTAERVVRQLRETARDAGPQGFDSYYGYGLLDAYAAVGGQKAPPFRPPPGDDLEPNGTPARATPLIDPYFTDATIAPQGDIDWFALDVSTPGTYELEVESRYADSRPESMYPNIQPFGPELQPLREPQLGQGSSVDVLFNAPVAGRYYLKVWNRVSARSPLDYGIPWGYVVRHSYDGVAGPGAATSPLWVRDASPADFAEGVAPSIVPTVTFGRAVNPASVTPATVRLTDATTGAAVPAGVAYDAATRVARVIPSAPLTAAAYLVTVTGVNDTAGTSMSETFSYRFTVGTTADTTPPETTLTFALWGGWALETGFSFVTSEPGSHLECSFLPNVWYVCDSPLVFGSLADGTSTALFRAVDAAGNRDATPASITWTMPPPNDNFADAQTISGTSGTVTGSTARAGSEPGEPRWDGLSGASAWYRWTAPASGTLTLDTVESDFDTELGIFVGDSVSSVSEVARNNDFAGTLWSKVDVPVREGRTYAIMVAGHQGVFGARGALALNWSLEPGTGPTDLVAPTVEITAPEDGLRTRAVVHLAANAADDVAVKRVEFLVSGTVVGLDTTAPYSLDWDSSRMPDGTKSVIARAVDGGMNTASSAARTITTDNTPPRTRIVTAPEGTVASTEATFEFIASEPGTFLCSLDGRREPCSSPQKYVDLRDGPHSFGVVAIDEVGNWDDSAISRQWTVDSSLPPALRNFVSNGRFEGSLAGWGTSNASLSLIAGQMDGLQAARVTETGKHFAAYTAPAAVASSSAGRVYTARSWVKSDRPGSVCMRLEEIASAVVASAETCRNTHGGWEQFDALTYSARGSRNTITIRFTRSRVNAGDSFDIDGVTLFDGVTREPDTSAPNVAVTAPSTGATVRGATTIAANATDNVSVARVEFLVGGGMVGVDESPPYTIEWSTSSTPDGDTAIEARAIDAAGNDRVSDSVTVTVDNGPETVIDSGPSGPVATNTATFVFSASEAGSTFECSRDGGAFAVCASPKTYTGLTEGGHVFAVRAVTPDGKRDKTPASRSWVVDTVAPNTSIAAGPTAYEASASALFSFTATEVGSTFECSFDGTAYAACTSPVSREGLSEGSHVFRVRASDAVGNADPTPASRSWTVDTEAPSVGAPETRLPTGVRLGRSAIPVALVWTGSDATSGIGRFEIAKSVDGGAWASVPLATATADTTTQFLAPGHAYQFRVTAIDRAGNVATAGGEVFVVEARQETSPSITYAGTWTRSYVRSAYGHYLKSAGARGAWARCTFTGMAAALVAPRGPDRGKAAVYVDGVFVKTIDLYSSTARPRLMVFSRGWVDAGTHVLELRALGTKSRRSAGRRIDIDACVLLR